MLKIDHKIPVPPPARGRGPAPKYPWTKMKVGDSFLATEVNIVSMRAQASRVSATHRIKLAVRPVEGGVRVWRVK